MNSMKDPSVPFGDKENGGGNTGSQSLLLTAGSQLCTPAGLGTTDAEDGSGTNLNEKYDNDYKDRLRSGKVDSYQKAQELRGDNNPYYSDSDDEDEIRHVDMLESQGKIPSHQPRRESNKSEKEFWASVDRQPMPDMSNHTDPRDILAAHDRSTQLNLQTIDGWKAKAMNHTPLDPWECEKFKHVLKGQNAVAHAVNGSRGPPGMDQLMAYNGFARRPMDKPFPEPIPQGPPESLRAGGKWHPGSNNYDD